MLRNLAPEALDLLGLPNRPSDLPPNCGPFPAENHLVPVDASPELCEQLETAGSFCVYGLTERVA